MQLAQIGLFVSQFAWQFALAILPSSAWLLLCHLIPSLRRRVAFSYTVAVLIVALSCILTRFGLTPIGILAGAVALVILVTRWHHALKHRSLEANTIIHYHHHDGS